MARYRDKNEPIKFDSEFLIHAINEMSDDEAYEFYSILKDKINVKLRKDKLNKLK